MRKLNEVVQYDFQRNTFYKVNKDTGTTSPTYKNGEAVKKFRPDVTGHSYLIRRKSQKVEIPELELRLPKEKSFNTQRLIPEYSYFKTMETSRRESKPTQASSILMRSTISKKREKSEREEKRENSFLRMREGEHEVSKQKSEEKASKALLNQTLTSYTKLLKEKPRQNNSPKRDLYEGSEVAKDPLDTLCTTLSYFRIKEPVWQNQQSPQPAQKTEREVIPLENKKEMTLKERSLFLDFHPEYRSSVKPSQVQVQVQRKRNLKILEDLFIRQGNRQTRRVYQSTA